VTDESGHRTKVSDEEISEMKAKLSWATPQQIADLIKYLEKAAKERFL